MDVTRGDRAAPPYILGLSSWGGGLTGSLRRPWEAGWWPLHVGCVARGEETRKKWRARVETGRCGKLAFRLVAPLYGFASRESGHAYPQRCSSSRRQQASLMPKKNTTCALKKTENLTAHH